MCDSLFLEIQCALGSKFSSFKKLHTETHVHTLTYKKEKTNKLKETRQNVFEFGITTIICKGYKIVASSPFPLLSNLNLQFLG